MQNEKQYPYVRAFPASGGKVHYQPCFMKDETKIYTMPLVGEQLIRFLEVDLTEYKQRLDRLVDGRTLWSADVFQQKTYDAYAEELWAIMELLKTQHIIAHGYLISRFDQIQNAVIYVEDGNVVALEEIQIQDIVQCIELLNEVIVLQKRFADITSLCLDSEAHKNYTLAERFLAVLLGYPEYKNLVLKMAVVIAPADKGVLDGKRMQEIFQAKITDTRDLLSEIHSTKEKGVSLLSCAILESFEEFLYFEFCEMLKNGLMAKKCSLCGRYFVSKDNRNRKYCNRIYEGNKTCKDIGAKLLFKEKTEDDPYLARYEDLRQAYYSRKYRADGKKLDALSGKDMTDAEYAVWSEMAVRERQRYIAGEISGDELITQITRD